MFDNPELTDAEIAELRPDGEGLPVALAVYKADGPGWQTRMNEALAAGVQSRR